MERYGSVPEYYINTPHPFLVYELRELSFLYDESSTGVKMTNWSVCSLVYTILLNVCFSGATCDGVLYVSEVLYVQSHFQHCYVSGYGSIPKYYISIPPFFQFFSTAGASECRSLFNNTLGSDHC